MYLQKIEFWRSIVEPRLQSGAKIANDLAVAVVVCRRGSTPSASNFKGHNIETRFYTDMETEDFLLALREVGISIFPFYREDDFMRWVIDGCDQLHGKRLCGRKARQSSTGSRNRNQRRASNPRLNRRPDSPAAFFVSFNEYTKPCDLFRSQLDDLLWCAGRRPGGVAVRPCQYNIHNLHPSGARE